MLSPQGLCFVDEQEWVYNYLYQKDLIMERNLISAQMSMKHAILMPNSPVVHWLCFDSAAWKDNNTTEPYGALCYPVTEAWDCSSSGAGLQIVLFEG